MFQLLRSLYITLRSLYVTFRSFSRTTNQNCHGLSCMHLMRGYACYGLPCMLFCCTNKKTDHSCFSDSRTLVLPYLKKCFKTHDFLLTDTIWQCLAVLNLATYHASDSRLCWTLRTLKFRNNDDHIRYTRKKLKSFNTKMIQRSY